jgi:ATP-dependent RNA helicase SUPV3L1/SUV3
MQRFIDKRTSALLKGLKRENAMEVDVKETGEVTVEGHAIGRLVGLRFQADPEATGLEERAVKNAAFQGLRPELTRRLEAIATGGINDFVLSDLGVVIWRGDEIAKLMGRQPLLKPRAVMIGGELGPEDVLKRAQERLDNWLLEIVARDLVPLKALAEAAEGESLKGLARGVAYRVAEAGGVMDRTELDADLKQLSQDDRKALRAVGLRFGRANIYAPALLKPRPARLHALFAFFAGGGDPSFSAPFLPPLGVTSFTLTSPVEAKPLAAAGFRAFGQRAVRLDIVDRIADALFEAAEAAKGPCVFPAVIVSLLGASNEDAEAVVEALGWEKFETTRPVKAAEAPAPESVVESVVESVPEIVDPVTEAAIDAEVNEGGTPDVVPTPEAEVEALAEPVIEASPEPEAVETTEEVEADEAEVTESPTMETVTLWRRKRAKPPRTDQRPFKRGAPSRAPNPRPQGQATGEAPAREARPPRDEAARPAQGQRRDGNRPPREGGFKRPEGVRPPHRGPEGRSFAAAPPRSNTGSGAAIDPNNPFAVLAALKLTAEPAKQAKGSPPSKKNRGNKPKKAGDTPAPSVEPQSE